MRRTREIMFLAIAVLCGLFLGPVGADGALITIGIEAVVDEVYDPFGYLEGNITPGDIITGSYTYDLSTPDTNPSLHVGDYEHYAYPCGISLSVGEFDFMTDPGNTNFLIEIVNDDYDDFYLARSYNNLPLPNGTSVNNVMWQLNYNYEDALLSTELSTTAPVLDDWGLNRLTINGGTRARPFGIMSHVTSAIPEPAALLLLGLGGLFLRKRSMSSG